MYTPGDRIVITKEPFIGVQGTFTRMDASEKEWLWAIWDDTNREQRHPVTEVKLVSLFRVGDIVRVGRRTVTITERSKIKEDKAVLVARKQLI